MENRYLQTNSAILARRFARSVMEADDSTLGGVEFQNTADYGKYVREARKTAGLTRADVYAVLNDSWSARFGEESESLPLEVELGYVDNSIRDVVTSEYVQALRSLINAKLVVLLSLHSAQPKHIE